MVCLKGKQVLFFVLAVAVCCFILLLTIPEVFAQAEDESDFRDAIAGAFGSLLGWFADSLMRPLFGFCQSVFLWVFKMTIIEFGGYWRDSGGDATTGVLGSLQHVWILFRDLVNTIIVVLFIYTSIITVFSEGGSGTRLKTLIALIAAAVFVNFSGFITFFLIDISHVLIIVLGEHVFDPNKFVQINLVNEFLELGFNTSNDGEMKLIYSLSKIFTYVFLGVALIGLSVVLLDRFFFAIVLIVTSPIFPLGYFVSKVGSHGVGGFISTYYDKWKKKLIDITVTPLKIIIGLSIVMTIHRKIYEKLLEDMEDTVFAVQSGLEDSSVNINTTELFVGVLVANILLILGFLKTWEIARSTTTWKTPKSVKNKVKDKVKKIRKNRIYKVGKGLTKTAGGIAGKVGLGIANTALTTVGRKKLGQGAITGARKKAKGFVRGQVVDRADKVAHKLGSEYGAGESVKKAVKAVWAGNSAQSMEEKEQKSKNQRISEAQEKLNEAKRKLADARKKRDENPNDTSAQQEYQEADDKVRDAERDLEVAKSESKDPEDERRKKKVKEHKGMIKDVAHAEQKIDQEEKVIRDEESKARKGGDSRQVESVEGKKQFFSEGKKAVKEFYERDRKVKELEEKRNEAQKAYDSAFEKGDTKGAERAAAGRDAIEKGELAEAKEALKQAREAYKAVIDSDKARQVVGDLTESRENARGDDEKRKLDEKLNDATKLSDFLGSVDEAKRAKEEYEKDLGNKEKREAFESQRDILRTFGVIEGLQARIEKDEDNKDRYVGGIKGMRAAYRLPSVKGSDRSDSDPEQGGGDGSGPDGGDGPEREEEGDDGQDEKEKAKGKVQEQEKWVEEELLKEKGEEGQKLLKGMQLFLSRGKELVDKFNESQKKLNNLEEKKKDASEKERATIEKEIATEKENLEAIQKAYKVVTDFDEVHKMVEEVTKKIESETDDGKKKVLEGELEDLQKLFDFLGAIDEAKKVKEEYEKDSNNEDKKKEFENKREVLNTFDAVEDLGKVSGLPEQKLEDDKQPTEEDEEKDPTSAEELFNQREKKMENDLKNTKETLEKVKDKNKKQQWDRKVEHLEGMQLFLSRGKELVDKFDESQKKISDLEKKKETASEKEGAVIEQELTKARGVLEKDQEAYKSIIDLDKARQVVEEVTKSRSNAQNDDERKELDEKLNNATKLSDFLGAVNEARENKKKLEKKQNRNENQNKRLREVKDTIGAFDVVEGLRKERGLPE